MAWTSSDIPSLRGQTIVVTGANSGLGFETARMLAAKQAHVVMACRTESKATAAMDSIRSHTADASLEFLPLDLADLGSVRAFAAGFAERHDSLHALCNNAGVMALPRLKTADGFEMQLGTNHFGHFALTGLLVPQLVAAGGPARVVQVSSLMHKVGKMNFDDLHAERRYDKWRAYSQSKLANLLFAYELQRRFEAAEANILSTASHPGYAATNLQAAGPRMEGSKFGERLMGLANTVAAQTAAMGALPTVYAAVAPDVVGGGFYGPSGLGQMRGAPHRVESSRRSHDREAAIRLWDISVEATGVDYQNL